MEELNRVTYVANAGVLIELGNKKILIDGFCNSVLPIYKNPPKTLKEQMIFGRPPFHDIDILFFTHHHSDHFDPEGTRAFLEYNKDTLVVSTKDVIKELYDKDHKYGKERFFILNPPLYQKEEIILKDILIQSISMLHEGKEGENLQNIGFLIEIEGKKLLHIGDAKPVKENFISLDFIEKNLDLLIAPFPYVGIPASRRIIERYIQPKKIIAIHLPYEALDDYHWINTTKKSYSRVQDRFIETIFFEEIGSTTTV